MNPKKINEFMQKKLGNAPEEEDLHEKRETAAYRIGLIVGFLVLIWISSLAWNFVGKEFGIPPLNFFEFTAMVWLIVFFVRIIRS